MYDIGWILRLEANTLVNYQNKPRPYVCVGKTRINQLVLMSLSSKTEDYRLDPKIRQNPHFYIMKDGTGLTFDSVVDFTRVIATPKIQDIDRVIKESRGHIIPPSLSKEVMLDLYVNLRKAYMNGESMQNPSVMADIYDSYKKANFKVAPFTK